MGKSRSGGEQEQAPSFDPAAEAANIQQSMFGDMMQRQKMNRDAQLMQRMQRQQAMGGLLMGLGGVGGIESLLDQLLQKRMQGMGLMQQQPQISYPFGPPAMPGGMDAQQQAEWRDRNSSSFYQGS